MEVQDRNRTENGKQGFIQTTYLHTPVHTCIHIGIPSIHTESAKEKHQNV